MLSSELKQQQKSGAWRSGSSSKDPETESKKASPGPRDWTPHWGDLAGEGLERRHSRKTGGDRKPGPDVAMIYSLGLWHTLIIRALRGFWGQGLDHSFYSGNSRNKVLSRCPHGHRQLLWRAAMVGPSLVQALVTCSLS